MNETDIKYLAGLLDADGSVFFNYTNGYAYLTITLDLAESIDKDFAYTNWLSNELGITPHISKRSDKWARVAKITVSRRASLETLVPRLAKYMVIKGAHLSRLFDVWRTLRGKQMTAEEVEKLKEFVTASRAAPGPVKPKEWLPKAYVAGFIDGDGSYIMKKASGTYNVNTVSHINDRCVADLLLKQYGGGLYYQDNVVRWKHSLGRSNKAFAIPFLKDMHRHSRLKKWKIEQFLNHHYSQRLTEDSPTGEIIV